MSNSPTNQNLPFRPQALSLQHVIEPDPNYWNDQLNYGFPSEFHTDPQADLTQGLLLPDSNIHQPFQDIRQFFGQPRSTISPDPAINCTPGNSYNPFMGINPAILNPGPLVKPVPKTFFQAGYHVGHDGTVIPIFVSSIFTLGNFNG
jgi:hypothetical protein